MTVRKISVSLSSEVLSAVDRIVADRGEERSPLVEMLLRENALVAREIQRRREEPVAPGTKKGRDVEKLLVLAATADTQWRLQIESGKVKPLGAVD